MTADEKKLLQRMQEIKRDYQRLVAEKERIIAEKESTIRFLKSQNDVLRESVKQSKVDIVLLEKQLKEAQ
jgi:hypothetical protein